MKLFSIYPDGGADPNPGLAGYGVVIVPEHGTPIRLKQGYVVSTNNRMEIRGVIAGLEAIAERSVVRVFSDSKYVVNAVTKGWIAGWKSRGWRKADKPGGSRHESDPVKNIDLWQALDVQLSRHQTIFKWVKGHAGNTGNHAADKLTWEARNGNLMLDTGLSDKAFPCQGAYPEPCAVFIPVLLGQSVPCSMCAGKVKAVRGKLSSTLQ